MFPPISSGLSRQCATLAQLQYYDFHMATFDGGEVPNFCGWALRPPNTAHADAYTLPAHKAMGLMETGMTRLPDESDSASCKRFMSLV